MNIIIKNIYTKIRNFTLSVDELCASSGELFVVLGPNGAGKTSLLELVAGFHTIKKGSIFINGVDVSGKPPEERSIGFVFQEYSLFPHLSVYENICFGTKYAQIDNKEEEIKKIMELLGICHLKERKPSELSGGEKQKVAIARALILKPKLLLLDEPFNSLDAISQKELRKELKNIIKKCDIPTIFVTHDQAEAFYLADRIGVLKDGKFVQIGSREEIFYSPQTEFVANFLARNIMDGRVISNDNGLIGVDIKGHKIEGMGKYAPGTDVMVCIRPEEITLTETPTHTSARNRFFGSITEIIFFGAVAEVKVDCGFELVVLVTRKSVEELALKPGKKAWLSFKATGVHIIPKEYSR